jgi:hypothetical protein
MMAEVSRIPRRITMRLRPIVWLVTTFMSLALAWLSAATGIAQAASVKATAHVPSGSTNFGGKIQWSLHDPGDLPTFFESEYDEGATGGQIVTGMESEIDNTFGFEADVSGNMVTIDGVVGNFGSAPAEVDMEWEVMTDPGSLPPQPNLPLKNAPRPGDCEVPGVCNQLSLFLAGEDGTSVPIPVPAILTMELVMVGLALPDSPATINAAATISPGMTTDDLNDSVDAILKKVTLPRGFSYRGLNNGFPTFSSESPFDFSVRIGAMTNEDPGFRVGFIALGAIPEPATLPLLLPSLGPSAFGVRVRRRRRSSYGK